MKKAIRPLLRLLLEILCTILLTALFDFLWKGVPLFGIPQAKHIVRVEVTDITRGKAWSFTDEEDIALARNCAGFLRYRPGSSGEGNPQISIRYTDALGRISEAAANSDTVFFDGKARRLKESGLFVNIIEGALLSEGASST